MSLGSWPTARLIIIWASFGGQKVKVGEVIVRQVGMTKRAGDGTFLSRNYTIHAAKDGTVQFQTRKVKLFSGKSVRRTEVSVV